MALDRKSKNVYGEFSENSDYTWQQFMQDVQALYPSNVKSTSGQAAATEAGTREQYIRKLQNMGLLSTEGDAQAQALNSKGSEDFNQTLEQLRGLLTGYDKASAFTDANNLIALQTKKNMEAQMPVIQRAIEGAGTSGSSMSALLSQRLAEDTAMNAGALGTETAKAYGAIASQLGSALSSLVANGDPAAKLANQLKIAQLGADAQIGSASIGANASMNNASTQAAASRYNAELDAQMKQFGINATAQANADQNALGYYQANTQYDIAQLNAKKKTSTDGRWDR